jgi:Flp pilus assembly protein TadG
MKRYKGNSGNAITVAVKPVGAAGHSRRRARPRPGTRGQALVEVAILVPFVFFLIVLVMNFGGLINAWIAVANASRAAADYAILSGSSAGLPTQATSTTLQNLINADLGALPNLGSSNPTACVRQSNNGTLTTIMEMPAGACANYSNPPSDGETIASGSTTTYANVAVDITYTYTPFFLGSRFLGYALPGLPTSVHQRSVMRIL